MNFKKFHVSRNLFDISTLENGIYLAANGNKYGGVSDGVRAETKISVSPNTAYTLSAQSSTNVSLRIFEWSNGTFTKQTPKYNISGSVSLTVTTTAETTEIAFNIEGVNGQYATNIMLNAGSQPLPYEPYDSEVWHSIPHYIHNTSTDTIATLPAVVYPNATTATVGLKGNMSQSSTPTPDNPIMPQSCGERTGNLFDYTRTDGVETKKYINQSGEKVSSNNYNISYPIEVLPNQGYIWSFNTGLNTLHTAPTVAFYDSSDNYISVAEHSANVYWFNFTTPNNCKYVRTSVYIAQNNMTSQLLVGSSSGSNKEPLPFTPYGIKIPISSASTTTPIYLGEVQTTRKIGKLVLTGEENWSSYSGVVYLSNVIDYLKTESAVAICTHYQSQPSVEGVSETITGHIAFSKGSNFRLCIRDNNYASATNFKLYLQQQYANGTPVTVWYVLATEETATINEPLMKIGDYADTLSNVSIPVTAGANTLSVDTTLQPSEVTATYKGWHPVADVHERENGAWT